MYWVIFLFTGLPSSLSSNERGVGKRSHDQLDYQSSGSEHHPRSGQYRALIGGGGGHSKFGCSFKVTRPKPVEHGYVFSLAVIYIGEGLKLFRFFVRGRKAFLGGGG